MSEKLLTKVQLSEALGSVTVHMVENLTQRRKIPVIKLGYRTHRYELAKVKKSPRETDAG